MTISEPLRRSCVCKWRDSHSHRAVADGSRSRNSTGGLCHVATDGNLSACCQYFSNTQSLCSSWRTATSQRESAYGQLVRKSRPEREIMCGHNCSHAMNQCAMQSERGAKKHSSSHTNRRVSQKARSPKPGMSLASPRWGLSV